MGMFRVASVVSFLSAVLLGTIPSASAGSPTASDGGTVSQDENARSNSTARGLFRYAEKYWDIARRERPIKVSVSLVDEPSGDGQKIRFHEVQFSNFNAGFYREDDGRILPAELSTASPRFKLPHGLKIGQSQAQVKAMLGPPTHVQRGSFIFSTGGDQNGEVIFLFKRGRLSQVTWAYDPH